GKTGATATLAQNYDIEDKVSHKLDDSALGLVRVKASNVFVAVGGNIGRGVTAASTGDTVNVEAGSYTENVTLAKRVALVGAGSGETGTILSSSTTATPVITVTGSGLDAANQLVIKDVRVFGAAPASASDGIAVYGDTPVSYVKVDGVHVTGHGQGVHYRSGTISNVTVANSTFQANNFGVRVATAVASMDGMTIDGCSMTEQTSSAITTNPSGSQTVVNTNFTVSNSTFTNNSRAGVANQHDLSFFGFRGNATLSNVTVTSGNGTAANSNSYGIVFTNASGRAALGTVSLSNVTVQGHVGKGALTFQLYNETSGVSLSDVSLQNCVAPWGHLILESTDTDAFAVGNTSLKTLNMWNSGGANATGANFYSSTSGTLLDRAVLADAFQIADQVADAVDVTGLGYVNFRAGHVYVTPASFDARFNTAQGALMRAIAAASAGDVIHVKNGTETYLTAEITKTVTFDGTFTVTSTSIPTGADATAVLSSFMSRKGSSTVTANVLGMNANQLAAVAANAAGFTGLTYPPVQVVSGASITGYFSTIQAAINFATAGDVVNVAAGTYAEDLDVTKAISLRGPNYGVSANTGTRVAEAVLLPATNNAASGKLIAVTASNVTVDGFTIDGDNPAISGGTAFGGVDSNCARALRTENRAASSRPVVSGIVFDNNVVRNFTTTGFYMFPDSPATNSSGNYVRNNLFSNMRFRGVYTQNEVETVIESNVFNDVHTGIAISSVGLASAEGFQPRIANNTINLVHTGSTTRHMGISMNHRYNTAARIEISGNTVNAGASIVNNGEGIRVTSAVFGGSAHLTNNTVDCNGTLATGLWIWNTDGQGEVLVTGGSVLNAKTNGLYLTDFDPAYAANSYSTGNVATISGTSITAAATGTAVNVHWTGTGSNLGPCTLTMQGGAAVGGLGTGMAMNGAKARVNFSGASPASFDGALPAYIALSNAGATNPATDIDATTVSFGGATGATATRSENFAIASKITDKLDSATL
ncbi:MAG: hypothetical protein ACOYMM_13850, partial [Phycisphaerales bacterium]